MAFRLLIFSIVSIFISGLPVSAENEPRPVVRYEIDVQLKPDERGRPVNLDGRERLTWLNDSPDTINELQFHLYLNAFKNEKSTFFRESGGQLRFDRFEPGEWGWIDIREMRTESGEDLTSKIEFIHPDDDNADDQTVIRVPLSRPVAPGGKLVLDIKFMARLPRVFARTGYWGQFAMVAQWFPKIGVWESVGERRRVQPGWNCHQFHANSEFYADFGVYDVKINVPAIYRGRVGATGVQQSETDNGNGTVTYRFLQENVHDFAWTIDPHYLVLKRAFKASEQVTPAELEEWAARFKLPLDQIRLKDVEVTVLLQPEHGDQAERHFAAAFNGIRYFGLWYGAYPYRTLTVVDPPYNAGGAGGMEYPTLITAGTSWRAGKDLNPEEVIVHEFGHQYWYGMVATNEFEESWLDEGFNTYSSAKVVQKAYGNTLLPVRLAGVNFLYLPVEIPHPLENRLGTLRGGFHDPIIRPTWKFYDFMSYGLNSYSRTALVLATLERYLGEDTMHRIMREYHQKWRYRHPTSEDFFETVNAVSGRDMGWYFDQFVRGTGTLDYEVIEAESVKVPLAAGIFDEKGRKVEVRPDGDDETGRGYRSTVTIRRDGEAWFPVELLLTFQDRTSIRARPVSIAGGTIQYQFNDGRTGRQWTETWEIADRWKRIEVTTPSPLQKVQIDPDRKVLLDSSLTNNSWTSSTAAGAAFRWSSGLMFWVQMLLQFFSALG
ncbi:MAG: M1 family metallopeptidase [Acidobacteriota bacterium]|nr:MAG: M1 family metallopeptidase [Acidobacteriota bacterium]